MSRPNDPPEPQDFFELARGVPAITSAESKTNDDGQTVVTNMDLKTMGGYAYSLQGKMALKSEGPIQPEESDSEASKVWSVWKSLQYEEPHLVSLYWSRPSAVKGLIDAVNNAVGAPDEAVTADDLSHNSLEHHGPEEDVLRYDLDAKTWYTAHQIEVEP